MLSTESEQIRNLVRFDVRHRGNQNSVSQLRLLEDFSSWSISHVGFDLEFFVIDRLRSGLFTPELGNGRPTRSTRQGLSQLLARAHQRILGQRKVTDELGMNARLSLRTELARLGLLGETTVPLSVCLLASGRRYEDEAHDTEKLGKLLVLALNHGIEIGDEISLGVRDASSRWLDILAPRKGTVLFRAVNLASANSGLTASELLMQTGANKSNVYRAIDSMEAIGALSEMTGRKKDQVWLAPELIRSTKQTLRKAAKAWASDARN